MTRRLRARYDLVTSATGASQGGGEEGGGIEAERENLLRAGSTPLARGSVDLEEWDRMARRTWSVSDFERKTRGRERGRGEGGRALWARSAFSGVGWGGGIARRDSRIPRAAIRSQIRQRLPRDFYRAPFDLWRLLFDVWLIYGKGFNADWVAIVCDV